MSYDDQCVAAVQIAGGGVKRCSRQASGGDPMYLTLIPVCSWHSLKAMRQFAEPLEQELERLKQENARHECDGDRAIEQYLNDADDAKLRATERWRTDSLAYFMRCGGYVKIGASSSPLYRLETIRHTGGVLSPKGLDLSTTELITTEPGGFDRERELHTKFAHLRHTGEWFTEAPELTDYINSLQEIPA